MIITQEKTDKRNGQKLTITQLEILEGVRRNFHRPSRGFTNRKRATAADLSRRKAKHRKRNYDDE